MRRQLLGLAGVSLLTLPAADCCGVGGPEVWPRSTVYSDCMPYRCPIAVGSKQALFVFAWSADYDNRVRAASLDARSLAYVTTSEHDAIVHPTATGDANLTITLRSGPVFEERVEFRDRAKTNILTSLRRYGPYEGASPPRAAPVILEGTQFTVTADHRDAEDNQLLGHGIEEWSITGGTLDAVPGTQLELSDAPGLPAAHSMFLDTARLRHVTAGPGRRLVVSAHAGSPPFEATVVTAADIAQLALEVAHQTLVDSGEITLCLGAPAGVKRAYVRALTKAGDEILGNPRDMRLTARLADPAIATALVIAGERAIDIMAMRPGTTQLTVAFGGITRSYRIVVQ